MPLPGEAIETKPLTDPFFNNELLQHIGDVLHKVVQQPDTRHGLQERCLVGVIARHETKDRSTQTMQRAQERMRAGELSVSTLWHDGVCVGLGTVTPGMPLRQPRWRALGMLPASLTRQSDLFARDVPVNGPHLQVWLTAEHTNVGHLSAVYGALAEEGGPGSWTVEPGDGAAVAVEALKAAGLQRWSQPARYDSHETDGIPPVSTLFYVPRPMQESDV